VSGNIPQVEAGEDCKSIVTNMFKNKINLIIHSNDISSAHRIGPKSRKQGPDMRKIMFKLVRRDLKSDILNACKSTRPDFYVNESLTPNRDKIYYILRTAAKKYPHLVHHCKTFDGNVTVFMKPLRPTRGSQNVYKDLRLPKFTLNTRSKLQEFLTESLSSSFDDLGVQWN